MIALITLLAFWFGMLEIILSSMFYDLQLPPGYFVVYVSSVAIFRLKVYDVIITLQFAIPSSYTFFYRDVMVFLEYSKAFAIRINRCFFLFHSF